MMDREVVVHQEEERTCFCRDIPGCLLVSDKGVECTVEAVALEIPVSISYNNVYHDVLSCTPRDLEDIAYGFSFTNGIISSASDIDHVHVKESEGCFAVDIRLRKGLRIDPSAFRLCSGSGKTQREPLPLLSSYLPACRAPLPSGPTFAREAIWKTSQSLVSKQRLHRETGATHAAAFVDRDGKFLYLREDVGRHNATDKLIGALVRNRVDPRDGFVYLSSRCALELVSKLVSYGVRLIATVSAPTSAVIDFAHEANVTLCAFARENRFTVYTHPERIELLETLPE
ncbi:MAG: formate dehydrogenase accessory sulfurtransferase FdhD [Raoultibacter sp.]